MTNAHSNDPRGAFFVFEGADRAGKSTQCQMLVDRLNSAGIRAELWRFPDRTTSIGTMINSYLTNEANIDDGAVHLLFSANRWEKRDVLLKKLNEGITLVVDRYAYSGVAFTAAKEVPGLDREWCKAPDSGLPAPDRVFFLNITAEAAAARGGFGEERYERPAFQTAVLKQFECLKNRQWKEIDASRNIQEISEEIFEDSLSIVKHCRQGTKIGKLWDP